VVRGNATEAKHGLVADLERLHRQKALNGRVGNGGRDPPGPGDTRGGTGSRLPRRREGGCDGRRLDDPTPDGQPDRQRHAGGAGAVDDPFPHPDRHKSPCHATPKSRGSESAQEVCGVHPQDGEKLRDEVGRVVTQGARQQGSVAEPVHETGGTRQRREAPTLLARSQRLPGEQHHGDSQTDLRGHGANARSQRGRQRTGNLPQRERRDDPNRLAESADQADGQHKGPMNPRAQEVRRAGEDGPLGAPHHVGCHRTFGKPPGSLARRQEVREPIAGEEIHAHHGGQGEIGEWEPHADELARQARLALPLPCEEPRGRLIDDGWLARCSAGLRELRGRNGPGRQGLRYPPLGGEEAGPALGDLEVCGRAHVGRRRHREQCRDGNGGTEKQPPHPLPSFPPARCSQ
jgi:hypothetical protein